VSCCWRATDVAVLTEVENEKGNPVSIDSFASGLVMVTIYNTLVDAKSWGADIPGSIQAARDYFKHVDQFRITSKRSEQPRASGVR
jgi:hypothetical protein